MQSINLIVSGLEVPDEVILAFRKAIACGVKVRVIVQQKRETTRGRLEKWRDIGAEVRYRPHIGMRLFVFDERVVYLVSYREQNRDAALGVRFDYSPIAEQMNQLFEHHWAQATDLY